MDGNDPPIGYGDKVRKPTGTRTYGRLLLRWARNFTVRGSSVIGVGTGTGVGAVRGSSVLGAGTGAGVSAACGSSVLGTGTGARVGAGGGGGAGSGMGAGGWGRAGPLRSRISSRVV